MILIITYKEDYTADFLINKLNEQGRQFFRLNTEEIDRYVYEWETTKKPFVLNGMSQFDGVWLRRLKLPVFNAEWSVADYLATEYDFLFSNMVRTIDARNWMSLPDPLYRAENKLVQLSAARALGFMIPKTLLSNSKAKIREFVESNKLSGTIIKPLFSGKIESEKDVQIVYTNEVDLEHLNQLEHFDTTPCIFQERLAKAYEIRVTVVGRKVFAARVNSQENEKTRVDWRKERLPFLSYELPADVSHQCIDLVESLNLSFGAIDLIKSTDGSYYFLEINPNGQWVWIEIDAGLPISQAIIDYLYDK